MYGPNNHKGEEMINFNKEFILAGDATFTVENGKGQHYTYHIGSSSDDKRPKLYFARVMTGNENNNIENHYKYLGVIDPKTGMVRFTKASKYSDKSTEYLVLAWAIKQVWDQREIPAGYAIRHNGSCGRCGRKLTNPESLNTGIGPECAKMLGE
jgi:hypothetical protein